MHSGYADCFAACASIYFWASGARLKTIISAKTAACGRVAETDAAAQRAAESG